MGNIGKCIEEIIDYFNTKLKYPDNDNYLRETFTKVNNELVVYFSYFVFQIPSKKNLLNNCVIKNSDFLSDYTKYHNFLLEHIKPILLKHKVYTIKISVPSNIAKSPYNNSITYIFNRYFGYYIYDEESYNVNGW